MAEQPAQVEGVPAAQLDRAYKALVEKGQRLTPFWDYYDGDHPLRYATAELSQKFKKLAEVYRVNWCAVVVDSVLDRLTLAGLRHKDKAAADALNQWWQTIGGDIEADDLHKAVAVCGEGYILADGQGADLELYQNDPRLVEVFYDPASPKRKAWAAKWWVDDEDDARVLVIYTPEMIYRYRSRKKAGQVQSSKAFVLEATDPNPYAPQLPVFHFRTERRKAKGELHNLIDPQDAFNKIMADLMMNGEYASAPQRYAITNSELDDLKAGHRLWEFPAADKSEQPTAVGQFDASQSSNFTDPLDRIAAWIAVLSRTPKHYLLAQGAEPSGEALQVAEAGLVKKAKRYQTRCGSTWQELGAFVADQIGAAAGAKPDDIQLPWEPAETSQPKAQAETRKLALEAGMPLLFILKRYEAWDDAQLTELEKAMEEERKRQKTTLGESLLAAYLGSNELPGSESPPAPPQGPGTPPAVPTPQQPAGTPPGASPGRP